MAEGFTLTKEKRRNILNEKNQGSWLVGLTQGSKSRHISVILIEEKNTKQLFGKPH